MPSEDALTREKLQALLRDEGVDPRAYRLFGQHDADAYVIDHRSVGWVVFYSERGGESDLRTFASEDSACRYLLDRFCSDPTTRRSP